MCSGSLKFWLFLIWVAESWVRLLLLRCCDFATIIVPLSIDIGNTFSHQNVRFREISKQILHDQLWDLAGDLFLCLFFSSEVTDNRNSETHCNVSFPLFCRLSPFPTPKCLWQTFILCFILKSDLWLNVNEIEFSLRFHYILLVWTFFKAAHQNPLFSMNK